MYEISYQKEQSSIIRFNRTVYSRVELKELQRHVEQAGARIIRTTALRHGDRITVLLEMDERKRQF